MKQNEKILTYSSVFGLMALLIGALGLYTEFGRWLKESNEALLNTDGTTIPPSAENLLYWSGGAGLILSEMILSLCFVLASMLMMRAVERNAGMKETILSVGIFRILISLSMFLIFFKDGWYYILENNKFEIFVVLCGAAQGITLFFAKKEQTGNSIV